MYLVTKQGTPKKDNDNTKCYMIIEKYQDNGLLTKIPELGIVQTTELAPHPTKTEVGYIIDTGFETYWSYIKAMKIAIKYYFHPIIIECCIPRKTKFYEGHAYKSISFRSEQLIFNKIIEDEDSIKCSKIYKDPRKIRI